MKEQKTIRRKKSPTDKVGHGRSKEQQEVMDIIKKNVFTYFNGIFLLLAILLIIAGSYRNLTFLPLVISNTLIGIFQQLRAKKVLDELTLLSQAQYRVIRKGQEMLLPNDELRAGDLILLEGGQQIPGDAELIQGTLTVNESLLTGESDEIEKQSGQKLMSGSFAVSGRCKARLVAVGKDSYIEKLTAKAKEMKEHQSEMIRDIDYIVKFAGIAIIPIGLTLMIQGIFINDLSFSDSVSSMVGAVIGMIPEGLYLLVTAALVLSAMRLAMNQVLLHDMKSTETLARVDVLCVDKTGTITSNAMSVSEIIAADGRTDRDMEVYSRILSSYVNSTDDNNATSQALRAYYPDSRKLDIVHQQPFSSRLKYSEVETEEATYRLGAPEFILTESELEKQSTIIEEQSGLGKRVLVFAQEVDGVFAPLLFITLTNELRPNVEETFAYLAEQEVKVVVISGDNPRTVSEIAQMVGIPEAENAIDARKLSGEKQYREATRQYTVFGRVKPEQKKDIIKAFQSRGLRVAMTGDGVNDILAMKEADCSIAMGSGSDAAMQAAQVVLLDSDFSHMRQIIAEGRRDINNITRSATLFIYKNLFSLLLAIFSIVNLVPYPLKPAQISLVSMFNIGVPAFLLALEPNVKKQHGRFLQEVLRKCVPAALTSFLSIATLVVFSDIFHISSEDLGTASTYLLSIVGFMILFKLCRPMNVYRRVVFFGCIIGFIFSALMLPDLFYIESLSYPSLMLAIVFAIAQDSLMRHFTNGVEWLFRKGDETVRKIKESDYV